MTTPLPFYTSRRQALGASYARFRSEVEQHEVASIHMHSGLSEVKPKERARIEHVQQALETGVRLYQKDPEKPVDDAGGSVLDRMEAVRRREGEVAEAARQMGEARFQTLAVKWADKTIPRRHVVKGIDLRHPDTHPTITTPDGRVVPDPDQVRCSFCGVYVHRSQATFGKGSLDKTRVEEIIEINGIFFIDEKIVHFTRKLVACKDHCLMIKNTVFPETRG